MSIAIDPSVSAFLRSPHGLLIDGESGPARSGAEMPLYDPATGAELARVARAGAEDVDRAVAAARRAFEGSWAGQRPADRERLLLRLAERIEAHGEQLAQLETLNNGKSINLSRALEVGASVEFIRYMAGWATKIEGRSLDLSIAAVPGARYRAYTVPEPVGVVGAIVPWNFPLLMAIWKIVPALACGCTVVLKPADETPLTALRLGQLCLEAGIPPGVVNIVTGTGAEAGAALAAHPGIDKLAFTGSTPVGKLIGHAAVENMTRFSLELGGKSPVIILDDTSLDMAAAGSAGAIFFNQGQVCTAGSRLYVQRKRFDQVLERLAAIAGDLSIGPGLDPTTQINPLVSARQQERVLGMIEGGVAEGASVVCGGGAPGRDGVLRAADDPCRRHPGNAGGARGNLRTGTGRDALRRSRRSGAPGQRQHLRARCEHLVQRPAPGHGPGAEDQGRHRMGECPQPARPVDAVRRLQAVRHRPRDGPCGDRGVHREQVGVHRLLISMKLG